VILVVTLLQLQGLLRFQEEAGFVPPKKTQWIWGYSAFCLLHCGKKKLQSSSTPPSVFLPDNAEPYPLKMKLHPSILLNKYAHSFQTKPQGHK
jgi:hypothetical protein